MIKQKRLFLRCIIMIITTVVLGLCAYQIIFQLGLTNGEYYNKEPFGKYDKLILSQYASLNNDEYGSLDYKLPEQYYYFGRPDIYVSVDEWENGQPILDDRLVSKGFFSYNNQNFYFYYSIFQADKNIEANKRGDNFEYIWKDIYDADRNEISFNLYDNPEGLFIIENYLYYSHGKNFYNYRIFAPLFQIYEDTSFAYLNLKKYKFAKLDLDSGQSIEISRKVYEEKYYNVKEGS